MKTRVLSFVRMCVTLALLGTPALSGLPPTTAQVPTHAATAATPDLSAALVFIQNAGQFPDDALFQVRGRDLNLWLAEDALWLTVLDRTSGTSDASPRTGVNIRLSFPGSNPHPRLEPFNRLETQLSFFTGGDPANWRADVPAWGGVRYAELYPGIDLELTGEQGGLVPRLAARPGADLGAVRLRVEGADAVAVRPGGDALRLSTAAGDIAWPLLHGEGAPGAAAVQPQGALAFEVTAPFAPAGPTLSDALAPDDNPADLLYGTFLGGTEWDYGNGIAVDGSGAAYVTGSTSSSDFPTTPGGFDTTFNGYGGDAFVAKLNPAGSGLEYATFLGGMWDDRSGGIAIDGSGAAYVTGYTYSSDFPTTPGAFDTTFNGGEYGYDAFVVKLNPAGSALEYATFLGGTEWDSGNGIAIDGGGAAYVTGYTYSSDFPTTPGAFDTTFNGGRDAFVVKLNPAGSGLEYATFLGGSDGDSGQGIAVDGSGAAYVTGSTSSSDFPTTPGAFDTTFNGYGGDAFVAKLAMEIEPIVYDYSVYLPVVLGKPAELLYATFLGGMYCDESNGIAVDGSGAVYVTGWTTSDDFPTTPGAFERIRNNWDDAFVAKLNPAGSALEYATFLGGMWADRAHGIAVDGSGAAYVTGQTYSYDFPTTPGAFDTTFNDEHGYADAFVVKLNPAGSALAYATFLGGGDHDSGWGIAADGSGAAYVTGRTWSSDFPTTPGAFDTTFNGDDAFVAKLNAAGSALEYATSLGGSYSGRGYGITVDGSGAAYVTGETGSSDFRTTPGAFDRSYNGGDGYHGDAFVAKLNAAGSALAYATFLGGSLGDAGWGIAVDGGGAAYVTGRTNSSDFPTTSHGFDTTFNGGYDAFVVKLNAAGSVLAYATFLGGSERDHGRGIAVNGSGVAYVTGETRSYDFPTTPGAFDTTFNDQHGYADAFVAKLNAAGSALAYATFLGGSIGDGGRSITVDGSGAAYVTGYTWSDDFPTTPGAFDRSYNGGDSYDYEYYGDAFVAKLAMGTSLPMSKP